MTPRELFKTLDAANLAYEVVEIFEGTRLVRIEVDDTPYVPTPEQAAFIDAYLTCVASASEEECIAFFEEDAPGDGDAFTENYGLCTYSSIMDAWCVWQRATDWKAANL
jgi:hypothetical protein